MVALIFLVFLHLLAADEANQKKPKLLFFTAVWCEPCQKLKPLVSNLSKKYKVTMVLVDVDRSPKASEDFRVETLPTVVLLDPNDRLLIRTEGANKQIVEALTTAMKALVPSTGGRR